MKKTNLYKMFIINDTEFEFMITSGYCKKEVKNKFTSFYFKNNKIKDINKFYIFLIKVDYIDGDYVDLE